MPLTNADSCSTPSKKNQCYCKKERRTFILVFGAVGFNMLKLLSDSSAMFGLGGFCF